METSPTYAINVVATTHPSRKCEFDAVVTPRIEDQKVGDRVAAGIKSLAKTAFRETVRVSRLHGTDNTTFHVDRIHHTRPCDVATNADHDGQLERRGFDITARAMRAESLRVRS